MCRVRIPATAVSFALFGQFPFLAPLLTELFLCFPFLLMHVFCINNLDLLVITVVELTFALKMPLFGLFGLKQA
jgi:hypothetical protein